MARTIKIELYGRTNALYANVSQIANDLGHEFRAAGWNVTRVKPVNWSEFWHNYKTFEVELIALPGDSHSRILKGIKAVAERLMDKVTVKVLNDSGSSQPTRIYDPVPVVVNVPAAGGAIQTSGSGFYVVQAGDNLSLIASRHGVSLNDLLSANPEITNPNIIYQGQKISIPRKGTGAGTVTAKSTPNSKAVTENNQADSVSAYWAVGLIVLGAAVFLRR